MGKGQKGGRGKGGVPRLVCGKESVSVHFVLRDTKRKNIPVAVGQKKGGEGKGKKVNLPSYLRVKRRGGRGILNCVFGTYSVVPSTSKRRKKRLRASTHDGKGKAEEGGALSVICKITFNRGPRSQPPLLEGGGREGS